MEGGGENSGFLRVFERNTENTHEFQVSLAQRINSKLNYLMTMVNKQEYENQILMQALKESEELSQSLN